MAGRSPVAALLSFLCLFQLASTCITLPYSQYLGGRPYFLHQQTECKGGKVYQVDNVRDIGQCKEACIQFDCAAVNLFQVNEFQFTCEILSNIVGMIPAQGSACYATR